MTEIGTRTVRQHQQRLSIVGTKQLRAQPAGDLERSACHLDQLISLISWMMRPTMPYSTDSSGLIQ